MPDTDTANAGETTTTNTPDDKAFEPIATQEDLDRIIQARLARERKNLPTDYDDLKAKAEKLAQIEEANKTEAEKAQERLDAAEKRAGELELRATKAEVAAAKGVPAELLSGSTQDELEAAADALIAFRGEQKVSPRADHSQGPADKNGPTDPAQEFAAIIRQATGR